MRKATDSGLGKSKAADLCVPMTCDKDYNVSRKFMFAVYFVKYLSACVYKIGMVRSDAT